jgi:hypothetical protein
VPAVLVRLCDAIRDLRGLEREGIFRQTANRESMDALKTQLDQGNLDFKASSFASVDVPAAVLKNWLRYTSSYIPSLSSPSRHHFLVP